MKQTAVEKLAIAFRQWQTDWGNFDKTGKNQPAPYDEFIAPFLEMEKQQIIEAHGNKQKRGGSVGYVYYNLSGEQYYNETYKSKQDEI
jgi:hypothetical protein